jgi:hypothetical protein
MLSRKVAEWNVVCGSRRRLFYFAFGSITSF